MLLNEKIAKKILCKITNTSSHLFVKNMSYPETDTELIYS